MRLKNIFTPPKKEILNKEQLFKNEKSSYKEFFIATVKETDEGLILNESFFHKINYLAENKRLFSEYSRSKMNLYKSMLVDEVKKDFPHLILGEYLGNNEIKIEGFIKDYPKINPLEIIDYYFTMKSEQTYYSKDFFEKEYEMIFGEIVSGFLKMDNLTFSDFDRFLTIFFESFKEVSKTPIYIQTEEIKGLLRNVFKNVKVPSEQLRLTNVLISIGFFERRYVMNKGNIVNPLYDDFESSNIKEFHYVISQRIKEIY